MAEITIAIPTYNRSRFLVDCIQSILGQTFCDFEIIVFDNHSEYDIEFLLERFNDSRIKLVKNEKNLGYEENFKRILLHDFNSEYVVIFHDDDAMHPKLLEVSYRCLLNNKDCVWVGTGTKFIKDDKNILKFINGREKFKIEVLNKIFLVKKILSNFNLCFDSVMYRSKFLKSHDSEVLQFKKFGDRPYLINLIDGMNAAIIEEGLVNYRIHSEQSSQDNDAGFIYMERLFKYYESILPHPMSSDDKRLFLSFSTNNLILSAGNFSNNWKKYFLILNEAHENGLFNYRYINFRGLYYFLKSAVIITRKNYGKISNSN